jgi:hypothetical protein
MIATAAACIIIGLCDPALGRVQADDARAGANARVVLAGLKEDDAKLRAKFREVSLEYKKVAALAVSRDAAQAASVNQRLSSEVRGRYAV